MTAPAPRPDAVGRPAQSKNPHKFTIGECVRFRDAMGRITALYNERFAKLRMENGAAHLVALREIEPTHESESA